jgi:hypothetical protein
MTIAETSVDRLPDKEPVTSPPSPGEGTAQKMDRLIRDCAPELQHLHNDVVGYFEERTAGKVYTRRPNLSVRLVTEGGPPAKLIIVPAWNRREKRVDPGALILELLVARSLYHGPSCELRLHVGKSTVRWDNLSCRWGTEALNRILDTVRSFLQDPFITFARSADRCCICDKLLTDGASRARGIGPECLKKAGFFRRMLEAKYAARDRREGQP